MQLFARKVNNWDLYANHAWYVPGVKGMFALLAWFLLGSLLGGLVIVILGAFLPAQVIADYGTLVAYPLSFLPAMVYAAHQSQRNSLFEPGFKLDNRHWGPYPAWAVVLLTIAIAVGTMLSADLPNYLLYKGTMEVPFLQKMYDAVSATLDQLTGGPIWSAFLLTAIFAPIFEEWLCRGMVLRGLLTRMKPTWAIVVSALFFAVIHMNPWQALNAFIIGVVMGIVYYRTGSLWLTMLIHFVNNATAVVLSQIPSLSEYDFWIDILGKEVYVGVFVLGVLVLAVCLWAFRRIPLEQERGNLDSIELVAE